jgi:ABC-2 type transport system ATP-binding protein
MIEVAQLTKRFGSILAVDRIWFDIGRGEIVGLLGPNGAGKTTTMRMLTTFVSPTSGRASLMGYDVIDQPLDVRRSLGYLPENVPLYPEMRVSEYLGFRARLKGIARRSRSRAIAEVASRCGLSDVEHRVVGHLSRGYRQRVGLADALLNDPPILILDEPTAGLDPIQIREVRALIRELGDRHTILVSTHIMSEVEAICERVIVIAGGRIALDDRLDRIRVERSVVFEARGPAEPIRQVVLTVPGVERVFIEAVDGEYVRIEASTRDGADPREGIGERLVSSGWPIRYLDLKHRSLEDRFVEAVSRVTLIGSDAAPDVA